MSKIIKIGEIRIAVDSIALYYPKDGGTRIEFKIAGNQSKNQKSKNDTMRVFRSSIFIRGLNVERLDSAISELILNDTMAIYRLELPKVEDCGFDDDTSESDEA